MFMHKENKIILNTDRLLQSFFKAKTILFMVTVKSPDCNKGWEKVLGQIQKFILNKG